MWPSSAKSSAFHTCTDEGPGISHVIFVYSTAVGGQDVNMTWEIPSPTNGLLMISATSFM